MKVIDINDIIASDTFEMGTLREPKELWDDVLPTGLDVYKHFLHLTNVKCASGAWKQRTDIHTKVSCLLGDISSLWNITQAQQGGLVQERGHLWHRSLCSV